MMIVRCVLACSLISASFAFAESPTEPAPRDSEAWLQRHALLNERAAKGDAQVVFIGDSITQGWEAFDEIWNEFFAPRQAINLGISGDRTQHVLWRLENGNIDGINPKLGVIMIGTNNTPVEDDSPEEIAAGITAIVQKLQAKFPELKILLLGVFPREEKPGALRAKVEAVNSLIVKLDDGDKVTFLDIGTTFLDPDGTLPKSIMPDSLHLNAEGYRRWAEAIDPYVASLLGEYEWQPLFNGADLTGWEVVGGKESWGVEDGMLYTSGGEGGGWLSTEREFGNFDLELEFRVPADGNSGVFIRAPRHGNPAYEGSEIQVLDDAAAQYATLKPWQYTGSVYSTQAPERRVTRPAGEWQKMRIRAVGPEVDVYLNGYLITEADLSVHPEKEKEHPGLTRKGGYIGLQNHGSRLDYRNIRIHPLP